MHPIDTAGAPSPARMFRKKPVVVAAYQLPSAGEDVSDSFHEWCEAEGFTDWQSGRDQTLIIMTLEGAMTAQPGDWIIKGVKGEFYPCKPDIFAATYEPVAALAAPGERAASDAQRSGPLDANDLEEIAKQRPDDMFLKGSGVLKLIGAIRQLEGEVRSLKAAALASPALQAEPVASAKPTDFEHWLNSQRGLRVAEVFHDIVARFKGGDPATNKWWFDLGKQVAEPVEGAEPVQPKLAVWFGSMPESNGRKNWTAMLHREGEAVWSDGAITFMRSEYQDRVRYEADCLRWLIGEIADEPDILKYDSELGAPEAAPASAPVETALHAAPTDAERTRFNHLREANKHAQPLDGVLIQGRDLHALLGIALAAPGKPQESDDTERLDWLETKTVNVRNPLRYGSADMFWASPEDIDGEAPGPNDIRAKIDAARKGEPKP